MNLIGNIIWLIFGGLISAISFLFAGLLCCITIVGIPVGLQLFKLAELSLAPFGKNVVTNPGKHIILNIIWLIICGLWLALGYLFLGIMFCITIVGIPFGLQIFKFAKVVLMPFGAEIK